jgi:hypothetical protein
MPNSEEPVKFLPLVVPVTGILEHFIGKITA